MATVPGDILFYVVLVAPGFIAVMTAVSLAAVEDEISQFVLLIWSLVSSIIIDGLFLAGYQLVYSPIRSYEELRTFLFDPFFRVDLIAIIFLLSGAIGVAYAVGILVDLPGRLRRTLQAKAHITYNPRQPWENFMKGAGSIRIKTSDDELYTGDVVEWSRAGKPKEVRVKHPYRYSLEEEDYEWVGGESMLFLEDDIDRILLRVGDGRESFWARVRSRLSRGSSGDGEGEGEDDN
ncbi:DUF6338 family protein [Halarchaeum salinum]|uniref:Uncharacterized protein n=1 Tax=Halarchaeum salinum TaxID=489912 RepID=A0AAV3S4R0_9EURY